MDKIIETGSYGLCLFSLEVLQEFLKREKIRSKKLLALFQKDKERFLATQKEGIWIPLPQINSIAYVIRLEGFDEAFGDDWEQKFKYEGFNIEIKDGLWISDIGSFYTFQSDEYVGDERTYKDGYGILHSISPNVISYQTLDHQTVYSDHKYEVPSGKYLLSICGYVRKQSLEYPTPNNGFFFSLARVDEFNGFKNAREDIYDFNVAQMK